jgi:hypothetical protein
MNRRRFRFLNSKRVLGRTHEKPADQCRKCHRKGTHIDGDGQNICDFCESSRAAIRARNGVHHCNEPECLMRGKKLWSDDISTSSAVSAA